MRILATLWLLLGTFTYLASSLLSSANAQTLTEKLLTEGPVAIGKAAVEKGDPVRGAILFSQKKLNCTGCHQPRATDLLGPDLWQLGPDVTPEYFVEAILEPSKIIKEGFQSTKLLTIDGQIVIGRTVDETPTEIVLRTTDTPSRLLRISKDDIELSEPNPISTMPAGLADQLENRQQFLDIIKYLMDIAASGEDVQLTQMAGQSEVPERLRGLALIDQYRCTQCHAGTISSEFPAAVAPDLKTAAVRISPEYLTAFLSDPVHTKPGTSMPNVLAKLDTSEKAEAVSALYSYLRSLSSGDFERQNLEADAASRGNELFHSVGCVACHSPRDSDGVEILADESVALGDMTQKYSLESLSGFLEDPHVIRPSGRMPNLSLTHWEAIDIASYLLTTDGVPSQPIAPETNQGTNDELTRRGRELFNSLGCNNCHAANNDSLKVNAVPLAELPADDWQSKGCLSEAASRSVHYELSSVEKGEMASALGQLSEPMTSSDHINLTMQTLQCFNCHQRNDHGGIADNRDIYFKSENENLGPQGRIPPTLTHVGAKLNTKWLRQVLVSGRAIRPYVKTRMPQYGAENVEHLTELLSAEDQLPDIEFGQVDDPKEAKKIGTDLVGQGGLNCVACHTFQQKPAQTMPAVDLTEMAERLQRPWFEHYMRRPQALSPGTVMPSFWPGGKAIRKEILDGNSDQQIAAIWEYLLDGRQARTPRGLDIKPIELLASDEAVMLRRSYQGIGKRGIGVGYPGNLNLAYDAEQMRLAMIWQGEFADPGGVWRGQGSGTVRPLSRDVVRFSPGPDLDDAANPWIVDDGRPPLHQFKGYQLDETRRPRFMYMFDSIQVEDYFTNTQNQDGNPVLKRQLTLVSPRDREGLTFRIATGGSIEQVDATHFIVDGKLRITVPQDCQVDVALSGETKQLMIPLQIEAGQTQLVFEYQ